MLILTAPGTVLSDMDPLNGIRGWASLFFVLFVLTTNISKVGFGEHIEVTRRTKNNVYKRLIIAESSMDAFSS